MIDFEKALSYFVPENIHVLKNQIPGKSEGPGCEVGDSFLLAAPRFLIDPTIPKEQTTYEAIYCLLSLTDHYRLVCRFPIDPVETRARELYTNSDITSRIQKVIQEAKLR